MKKVRVYEIAKQLNVDQKNLVTLLQSLGYAEVRNHMSAVDEEAIERVKRNLDRGKTPAVVEQRIAPTVVKRRAAATRPGSSLSRPSSPSVATPAPTPAPAPAPVSAAVPPVRRTRQPAAATPAEKAQALERPSAPLKRSSSVDTRPQAPAEEAPPPVVVSPPVEAPPEPQVAPAPAEPVAAPAPVDMGASPPAAPEPEPEPAPAVEQPMSAEPAPAEPVAEAGPAAVEPVAQEPKPVAPPTPPPPPPPVAEPAPPPQREAPPAQAAAPVEPARREAPQLPRPIPSQPPRTGIETWAGRPGVPMRQPPTPRPQTGPVPRRVQYDPRAVAAAGKPDQRGQAGGRGKTWGGKGKHRLAPGQQPLKKSAMPSTKEMSDHKKVIKIEEKVSLQTLAQRMSLKATEVLMKLLSMGMPGVNINSTLDADTAKLVASEFGWAVEDVAVSEEVALGLAQGEEEESDDGVSIIRPPIVTVMGHVDHGKTSLLDQIRKANVAASEAGGITQHIGAYKVNTSRGQICFLDTPGHAAFTQMRARGAQVTDLVILVVAADDGVMPQTREAVNHARAAKVPIIVAVNKIDKAGSQPDRIRRELAEMDLVSEEWGGETIYCNVSAKTREGIDTLLEMTALQAEILELRAHPGRPAVGNVLEALLDRGRGPVARVVITDGTLHTGDVVLAGAAWGKVRAMTDDRGRQVAEAGPSTPVEILGLSEVPSAGDPIHVVKDPKKAQEIALSRKTKLSRSLIPVSAKVTLEELAKRIATEDQLELRLIIKADVQGSVEALAESLAALSGDKVRVAIIHAAVGGITEGDVNLAVASKAIIVGFNVRPAGKANSLAESEGIEIRLYNVIYDAVDEIKKAMVGMIGPTIVEKILGRAEVRQTFHIAKIGTVAGCIVSDGTLRRNAKVRLVRDAVQIWEGKLSGLKRFKEDAKEVDKGFECGVSLEGYNDVKVGDVIECFEEQQVQATL